MAKPSANFASEKEAFNMGYDAAHSYNMGLVGIRPENPFVHDPTDKNLAEAWIGGWRWYFTLEDNDKEIRIPK